MYGVAVWRYGVVWWYGVVWFGMARWNGVVWYVKVWWVKVGWLAYSLGQPIHLQLLQSGYPGYLIPDT